MPRHRQKSKTGVFIGSDFGSEDLEGRIGIQSVEQQARDLLFQLLHADTFSRLVPVVDPANSGKYGVQRDIGVEYLERAILHPGFDNGPESRFVGFPLGNKFAEMRFGKVTPFVIESRDRSNIFGSNLNVEMDQCPYFGFRAVFPDLDLIQFPVEAMCVVETDLAQETFFPADMVVEAGGFEVNSLREIAHRCGRISLLPK